MITQSQLKALMHYDSETGMFRRIKPRRGVRLGNVVGTKNRSGYILITIEEKKYMAHRLAFLFVEGTFPLDQVDHINGIRDDNKWKNLRHATRSVNAQNQRQARCDNQHGFMGVTPVGNRFKAQIKVNNEKIYLGLFDTPEQAHTVYLAAKRNLHAEACTI